MKEKKKILKIFTSIVVVSFFYLFAVNVSFATDESNLEKEIYYVVASNSNTNTEIKISTLSGQNYLFLPSSANLNNFILNCTKTNTSIILKKLNGDEILIKSGESFDFENFYGEKPLDGVYNVKVIVKEYSGEDLPANSEDLKNIEPSSTLEMNLNIMKSSNIDSIFIESSNPETEGRTYIEASKDHSAKANGNIAVVQEDGTFIYDGTLKEIKGRGNTTWSKEKKPYQIKLDKKVDLLDLADGTNANKKWVLLADYMDTTFIRNRMTYNLGKELGLTNSPDCKTVDLYYDGEYRGTYLLSEKVEISKSVNNIYNLEDDIEKVNTDITDFDALPTEKCINEYGNEYQYVVGIKDAENMTGGYLLEIDNAYYASEKCWFKTDSGDYYVIKSPEYVSKEGMEYISNFVNEYDRCINNYGINPDNGKKLKDYIDIEEIAKVVLIQELSKNSDGFESSTYLYKEKDEDVLHAGSIWDFDGSYSSRIDLEELINPEGFLCRTNLIYVPEVQIAMQKIFTEELYPIINNIILGTSDGTYLKSIDSYSEELDATQKMNFKVWDLYKLSLNRFNNYEEGIDFLRDFISARAKWMNNELYDMVRKLDYCLMTETNFFDAQYYQNKYPDLKAAFGNDYYKLYEHYINFGIKEGRQASAVFNPKYYLLNYEDLYSTFTGSDKYVQALNHFMNIGIYEGRVGSSEFDISIYKEKYSDLVTAFGNNNKLYYEHYLSSGIKEKRTAISNLQLTYGIFFDAKYYADKYSDLKNAYGYNEDKLFEHYITLGIKEGRQASEIFNPVHYLKYYSDLNNAFNDSNKYVKALYHFLNCGIQEGRIGSYEFDINVYKNYKDLSAMYKNNNSLYYSHYINYGKSEGRKALGNLIITEGVLFNAEYYSNKYADLKNVYGMDYDGLYEHFKLYGIKEGRQASPVFNAKYYLEKYEDLKLAFTGDNKYINAYYHFLNYGMAEGRQGSEAFDVEIYKNIYTDLQKAFGEDLVAYYKHYIKNGMSEGRQGI